MSTSEIIEWGGVLIILILTFAETGLLLGLVIPGGETLLFTAGILSSTNTINISIFILVISLMIAGILGDISGYLIGKKFGSRLFHKKDTWYFQKKYLHATKDYYHKHKKSSILIGKFLPVIRPFNPVIAGSTGIALPFFLTITAIACIIYIGAFVLGGYFLGNEFPFIKKYLPMIIPVSIIIALIPVVIQVRKMKKEAHKKPGNN